MSNNNTIAGWVLAGGIVALGLSIATGKYFHAERPETLGYPIEGVESGGEGGGQGPSLPALLAKADLAKGEAVFKKCAACHTVNQGGAHGIGPNLYATMGKPLAGHAGFAYSDALKSKGGAWDFASMDAWLTSPRKFAEGTKMTFAGLGNPEERANLIAYMNAQGSNLPLPAVPAEGEAPAAAAATGVESLLATADVKKGEAVFKKCAACHTINQGGASGIGPNLYGAVGKPHAHVAGFAYSDALKKVPGNWDFKALDAWLESPRKYAPGTKMTFAGIGNPEERANLIAYLNTQGSNVPLPAGGAKPADAAPAK